MTSHSSELLVPSQRTTTGYGVPVEGYRIMQAPVRNATEACFEHELAAEPVGTVPVALVNRALGLGVYQFGIHCPLLITSKNPCSSVFIRG